MIRQEFHIFIHTLIFFTRIPWPLDGEVSPDVLRQTSRYFPAIGWLVGGGGAGVFWGASLLVPRSLALLLSMSVTILLTGALHEDGFIDACDGFGGGWTAERILAIMKDSTVGACGLLGMILLLAIKFASLYALPAAMLPGVLIAGHSFSRFAAISLLATHKYVREAASSKASVVVRQIGWGELGVAAGFGCLPLLWPSYQASGSHLATWGRIAGCLVSVGVVRWWLGHYLHRKIGGYTGDCLGAAQQITEVLLYLTWVTML